MKSSKSWSHCAGGIETKDKNVLLTGLPGSGKSTVMWRSVEILRQRGFTVGGIATPEVRSGSRRAGFSVVDLASGAKALMAGVEIASNYRVGKYGVDLGAFEPIALQALEYAEESCNVVAIDEIGRMELFSEPFKRKVDKLISGSKPVLAVLHRNYVKMYGSRGILFEVTTENRDRLAELVASKIESLLREQTD